MIRRIAALSALAVVAFAPAAFASEEADGCDHGATSKTCRPDPQPDRGKDCDKHGRHGGVNEDHCEVTPSTTAPTTPLPTTTAPVPSTATTTTTGTPPPTPSGTERLGSPSTTTTPAPTTAPIQKTELPATGLGSTLLVFFGLWCLLGGVTALALAQLIRGSK